MKTSVIVAAMVLLCACGGPDMSKVQKGMSGETVISLIGTPKEKLPMPFGIEWWKYGENAIVVMREGTVANVVSDAKATAAKVDEAMEEGRAQFEEAASPDVAEEAVPVESIDATGDVLNLIGSDIAELAKQVEPDSGWRGEQHNWWFYSKRIMITKGTTITRVVNLEPMMDSLYKANGVVR